MKTTTNYLQNIDKHISRISWGGVLAGGLTAISVAFLLNLLGLGIGLTSIDPLTDAQPFDGIGTGTLIWWILSNLAALFVGGMVAARTAGLPSHVDGGIHGFLSWGIYLIVSVFFLTSIASSALNGIGSLVSSAFGGDQTKDIAVNLKNAQKQTDDQTQTTFKNVKQEIYGIIETAETYNVVPSGTKEEAKKEYNELKSETSKAVKELDLKDAVSEFVNDINVNLDQQGDLNIEVEGDGNYINKEKLKNYLVNNTDLSEQEIEGVITKWENKLDAAVKKAEEIYAEAKQKALKASEQVSDAVGKASIYLFFILLLGSFAAFFGGATGAPLLTVDEEHEEDLTEK